MSHIIRKKKSKAKSQNKADLTQSRGSEGIDTASTSVSPNVHPPPNRGTDAEKRFKETQQRRVSLTVNLRTPDVDSTKLQLQERVAKYADKTHKDRVNEFNAKLEALSEHHDIPKV